MDWVLFRSRVTYRIPVCMRELVYHSTHMHTGISLVREQGWILIPSRGPVMVCEQRKAVIRVSFFLATIIYILYFFVLFVVKLNGSLYIFLNKKTHYFSIFSPSSLALRINYVGIYGYIRRCNTGQRRYPGRSVSGRADRLGVGGAVAPIFFQGRTGATRCR